MKNATCPCGLGYGGKGVRVVDIQPPITGTYPTTLFCPRCKRVWEISQKAHKPKEGDSMISTPSGFVAEHRWLWEQFNGPIPSGAQIHHLNGDHSDNRLENLVCLGPRAHTELHPNKSHKGISPKGILLVPALQKKVRELESRVSQLQLQISQLTGGT